MRTALAHEARDAWREAYATGNAAPAIAMLQGDVEHLATVAATWATEAVRLAHPNARSGRVRIETGSGRVLDPDDAEHDPTTRATVLAARALAASAMGDPDAVYDLLVAVGVVDRDVLPTAASLVLVVGTAMCRERQ